MLFNENVMNIYSSSNKEVQYIFNALFGKETC